jgi:hypothetical protein
MNARKHWSWVHPVLPAATDEITAKKIVSQRLIVDERVILDSMRLIEGFQY